MSDGCSWVKVYENRADGSVFSGNLGDLVEAIRSGADVQIGYFFAGPGLFDGEWRRTCSSVTYVKEEDSGVPTIVSCMITDIPDTQVDLNNGRTFAEPFAYEWQAYNTTGVRQVLKFNQLTGQLISDQTDRRQIGWWVRSRPEVDRTGDD
jgi:hypothetical protein